jgi:AraC family transcriptional regulator
MNSSCVNVAPHRTLDPHESHCEHSDAYRLLDRPVADGINHGVQIYPSDGVTRRTVTWDGMAAEIVQATRREKLEFRFHAPLHLLAIYDQGMRSEGDTFVEGLPRSRLRDVARKLGRS